MRTLNVARTASMLALCCAVSAAFAANSTTAMNDPAMPPTALSAPSGTMISDSAYKDRKTQLEADYKSARAQCDSLSDTPKDVCVAQAKAARQKGMAQLELDHKPTAKTREKAQIEMAKADYDVAKAQCGSKGGNDKDVCVQQAKAQEASAEADAKAGRKMADARADAREDKRDANYKVAIQKCDSLAGDAKDACVSNAKAMYSK